MDQQLPFESREESLIDFLPNSTVTRQYGLVVYSVNTGPFKIVARSTQRRVKVRAIGAAAHGSRPDEEFQTEICQPTYLILLGASQYRKPKGIHYL